MRWYLIVCSILLWGSNAVADSIPAFIKSQHELSLRTYLKQHLYYQLAPDSLCDCEDDLLWLRKNEPDFQPYYAVGDINDDQIEDFAVALLDQRKANTSPAEIDVVIFHGPFPTAKAKNGIKVIRGYKILRTQELISVFKSRNEGGHRLPARLDLGPGPIGSDDVQIIIYDKKLKKYRVRPFYD